jgi:hypothetical protein
VIKTDRTSVFISREAHSLDRLYIMVMNINFYRFLKNSNFDSKSKGVSLQFYRKMLFYDKTDRNSVFLYREAHIPDRLYIMVLYINFYMF